MEKKIVGGANKESSAGAVKDNVSNKGEEAGEAPPGGEAAAAADLTFKAKRERHKQLKNKKKLKQEEKEQK